MKGQAIVAPNADVPMVPMKVQRMSLIASPKEKKEKRENSTLSDELQTLLSCLYMDSKARLCLTYRLRCAQDLSFCHSKHYLAPMPQLPLDTQASILRCAWQQGRYVEFIQTASDMCVRCEFPGETIFVKLVELILTTTSPKQAYVSAVRVFRLFVHTFPPCWLALRKCYIKFFRRSIHIQKLSSKTNDLLSKSNKIFDLMFTLIEETFDDYAELLKQIEEEPQSQTSQMDTSTVKSQNLSQFNWSDFNNENDSFYQLKCDARLERINVVLDLLIIILEIDLNMWLLHNHRNQKEYIFHPERSPLVMIVFNMTQKERLTSQVKRLFTIFSRGIAMDLNSTHSKIMERYIALVMVASHTADIDTSIMGIQYPCLQANTKDLIREFFKVFKSHNITSLAPFLKVVDILRIPYVRFEFIDNFLRIFFHSSQLQMSPAKVINIFAKKLWMKYKLEKDISYSDEELSREKYFALLLKALRAYSDMYGLERVMRYIAVGEIVRPLQTVSKSVHHYPNRGHTSDIFLLEKMAEDIGTWRKQLRMQVRLARPKMDFPKADVCIDKNILASYRNDLKNCWLLSDSVNNLDEINCGVDINEWQLFTKKFKSETVP